jgi:alpha-glucosidase (family GH31 glycosyl hydrolase)
MTVTKRTLAKRYELLPVLYTLMWNAHINGGTVARSLVGNYPSDAEVRSIGNQFMWGSSLLITPVLEEGADSVKGYFSPTVPHYDAWTLQALNSNGGWMELPCPLEQGVLVHYVGGSILPTQPSTALTTAASRQAPFNLVVALDFRGAAKGNLFFDGRGDDLVPELNSVQITFAAQVANGNGIQWDVQSNTLWDPSTLPLMQTITVVGLWYGPNSITLDGAPLPSSSFSYDSDKEVLVLKNLDVDLNKSGAIVWNFPQGG